MGQAFRKLFDTFFGNRIVGAGVAGVILFAGLTFAALSISKRSFKPKQHMEPLTTQQEMSLDSPEMNDIGEEESNEANVSYCRWLPLDVARMWGRHWLEPLLAPNSELIIPVFPPSNYLSLSLTSVLNIASSRKGNAPHKVPLPPPVVYGAASFSSSKPSHSTSFKPSSPPYNAYSSPVGSAPPVTSSTFENLVCPICLSNSKDMAFDCGQQTCRGCGQDLQLCPICRSTI